MRTTTNHQFYHEFSLYLVYDHGITPLEGAAAGGVMLDPLHTQRLDYSTNSVHILHDGGLCSPSTEKIGD